MYRVNQDRKGTAFTVSVDAKDGHHHGHLGGRAGTHDPSCWPTRRPPATTSPGRGTSSRCAPGRAACWSGPGHTEAAVDLTALAGLRPAGVLCEIVNDDGSMARLPQLRVFARRHRLALISIADLIAYRRQREVQIRRVAQRPAAAAAGRVHRRSATSARSPAGS